MKKLFLLIVIMFCGQAYSQLEEGTYISNEYHYQELWMDTIKSDTIFYGEYLFDIDDKGIRKYTNTHIGRYFPWEYIGIFDRYPTYLLSNGDKLVIYDKVKGIVWYSDSDRDIVWYRIAEVYYNLNKSTKTLNKKIKKPNYWESN